MSRPIFRFLSTALVTLALLCPMDQSVARGVRSSSSSSRSSSRSYSAPTRSPSSSPSSGFSKPASSNTSSSQPSSRADSAFTSKVNRAGTNSGRDDYANSKTAAAANANRPTQFATEPATRPSYIPQSQTVASGRSAPVYYDSNQRGYGFWDDAGKWIVLGSVLNHNGGSNYGGYNSGGYGQQSQPYSSGYSGSHRSSSSGSGAFVFFIILLIVGVCVWLYMRSSNMKSPLTGKGSEVPPEMPIVEPASKPMVNNIDTWIKLPPGSFVTLSDQQALQDSKDRGDGLKGIDYKAESVAVAKDSEGFGSWVFVNLDDGHQKIFLLIKGVDDEIDYRVYYANPDFKPARREEVLRRGDTWLFDQADEVSPNAAPSLHYAHEINHSSNGAEVRYVLKGQGERQADYRENPAPSGMNDLIATVVEYSTGDPTENPELLVLEIGAASRRTGEVTLYFGCPVNSSEVEIVRA